MSVVRTLSEIRRATHINRIAASVSLSVSVPVSLVPPFPTDALELWALVVFESRAHCIPPKTCWRKSVS